MEEAINGKSGISGMIMVTFIIWGTRLLRINKFVNPFGKCFPRGFACVSVRWVPQRSQGKKAKQ